MFFQRIYDKSLAQASYVIGCQKTGDAIVIDAQRDIDVYLEVAKENQLNISKITETHIHADFLCGSRELAAVTGAEMYLSDEGGQDWQYQFPHVGLKNGDVIKVGNLSLEVVHTPGHTPESISFILRDHPASDEPVMMFTGDFVFVGDIGRPDLLEKAAGIADTKEKGAKDMFESLKKFHKLPDHIQVWPAHGAGSACGKALGAVPSSTVGFEKIQNWALKYKDSQKEEFVDELLADQPEPPKYFAKMKELNKVDRNLLVEVPKYPKLTKEEFVAAYKEGITIIDTRNKVHFANGFLPGSLNIQGNNSFSTWCGWFIKYDEKFILIAPENEMEGLTRQLMRIGLDQAIGYYPDVESLGVELEKANILGFDEFKEKVEDGTHQIVDLRNETEFNNGHIEGADHIFVGVLPENLDKISKDRPVAIHCQAGDRSSIGYSLLRMHGFENIYNYSGGMKEWREKNAPIVNSSTSNNI